MFLIYIGRLSGYTAVKSDNLNLNQGYEHEQTSLIKIYGAINLTVGKYV